MNKVRSSRELSTRSSGEYSNIITKTAKLIFYSLSELEILKRPLDFGRFPGEIRKMILEWALVEDVLVAELRRSRGAGKPYLLSLKN
jgi:hypothetical protein